jgi:RNA methyltransferase, TrmH family
MRRLTSRRNPIVARAKAAARGALDGAVLLDGAHLVADALDRGIRVRDAIVDSQRLDRPEIGRLVDRLARAGVEVTAATPVVMAAVSPVRSASAIVALADRPSIAADDVYSGRAPLVVVAVNVQDPGNVGAVIRVAEAVGATGVVMAGASADPFGWKALRGSMGSALRLPVAVCGESAIVAELRQHRCRIIATTPRGGRSPFDVDLTGPIALAIGGEGAGLPESILSAADERVTVPMQPPVESLNTAVTAAIVLYEALRQRTSRVTV